MIVTNRWFIVTVLFRKGSEALPITPNNIAQLDYLLGLDFFIYRYNWCIDFTFENVYTNIDSLQVARKLRLSFLIVLFYFRFLNARPSRSDGINLSILIGLVDFIQLLKLELCY